MARHQVQEAAVHARDAQETAGHAEPVPGTIAADSVDEFLTVSLGSSRATSLAGMRPIAFQVFAGAEN